MIHLLLAALFTQQPSDHAQAPGPQLKMLWSLNSQVTIDNRIALIKTLVKCRDGKTIRFVTDMSTGGARPGEQSPPQYTCDVDMATGAQKVVNTFSMVNDIIDGKRVMDNCTMAL